MEERKFCQCCGMPLDKPEDVGTESDGCPSVDYCRYCYQNGAFTAPDASMEDIIAFNLKFNEENGCECGKCDVCRAARRVAPPRRQVREREQNLDESILYILRKAPAEGTTIDYISGQTGVSAKEVAARVRLLADALKVEIRPRRTAEIAAGVIAAD